MPTPLNDARWIGIDEAIYRVHEASGITNVRLAFLESIQHVVPHQISFFDLKSSKRNKDVFFDPVSLNMAEEDLNAYYSTFIDKDYTSWVSSQSQDIPVYRDSDFISDTARENSVLFNKWLKPMDIVYGCSVNVAYEGIEYGSATLGRSASHGDFTDEELEALRIVARHLNLKFHQLYPAGIPYASTNRDTSGIQDTFHLTDRETELCQMLYSGLSTQEIANSLTVSINTVNRHLANIYKKASVNSRVALLYKMMEISKSME